MEREREGGRHTQTGRQRVRDIYRESDRGRESNSKKRERRKTEKEI